MSSSSTQPWAEDTQSAAANLDRSAVAILDRILLRLEVLIPGHLVNIQNLLQDLISISQCDPIDIDNGPWQASTFYDDEHEATLHGSQ